MSAQSFLKVIRNRAGQHLLFLPHAINQMSRADRLISPTARSMRPDCGGDLRKGTAPYHLDRQHVHVILDEVPAWVCSQCGEAYFEESEVTEIQTIIQVVDTQARKLKHSA